MIDAWTDRTVYVDGCFLNNPITVYIHRRNKVNEMCNYAEVAQVAS